MSKTSQGSNCQGTEQPFPPEEEEAEPKWEIPRWVINPGTPAGNRTKQQLNRKRQETTRADADKETGPTNSV